jgi:gliding motility-associated-like protein
MAKQDACDTDKAFWVRYRPKTRTISSGISENDTLVTVVSAKLEDEPCWHYITLTRSNRTYSLYTNGILRDQKSAVARLDLNSNTVLKIGKPVCILDESYKGDLDELRFHSKALSVDEINRYNLRTDQILNNDTLIYLGNSFQVNTAQNCSDGFSWSPASGVSDPNSPNPIITPTQPTLYVVQITHSDARCQAFDSIFVNVIDPDTLDCNKIFIPNAFTPGITSGRNDSFGVSNKFAVDEFISFEIFDRWGGRVFAANDITEDWDGNFQGQPVNPGVFLYRLRFKCKGTEQVRAGSLTLIR